MLVLTETAAEVVKSVTSVTSAPQAPQAAGLRISSAVPEPDSASALQVEAVSGPSENDQVLEAAGARVFVAPQAAIFLDDKVLDAQVDGAGSPRFSLGVQKPSQA
jgi:Fe-S cluster assembly iron-binding protein IscA